MKNTNQATNQNGVFRVGLALLLAAFLAAPASAEQPTADLASMDLNQLLQVDIGAQIAVAPPQADPSDIPNLEELAEVEIPGNDGLGKLIISYHYRHVINEGYRQGTNNLSDQDVLGLYPVVPVEIIQEAHILSLAYLLKDDFILQATIPHLYQSTFHLSTRVAPFTLESEGIGDVTLEGHKVFSHGDGSRSYIGLGLGLPTGTIEAKGDTPRGPNSQLPYAMQLGSGTFDLKPSAGWSKKLGHNAAVGADFFGAIRLGTNDRDYTLGHRFEVDVWYQKEITDWLRIRPEVDFIYWTEITGQDPDVTLGIAPVAEPFNYGGFRVDVGLTAQVDIPDTRGFVEFAAKNPVVQDLNGTQIGTEWIFSVGAQFRF